MTQEEREALVYPDEFRVIASIALGWGLWEIIRWALEAWCCNS
jgi:hypothetical protein